jgi:hypothetical protein
MPKGGSPYFAFVKVKRAEVVAQYPSLKAAEISKKLGQLWKALSDKEKAEYKEETAKTKSEGSPKKGCGCGSRCKGKKGDD